MTARGLSDIVGFTGHADDVPAALRSLDIVVHASTAPEPFGMVIAEGHGGAAGGGRGARRRSGGVVRRRGDGDRIPAGRRRRRWPTGWRS